MGEGELNARTMQYFMAIWPILMSLGMGGSIVGALYGVYVYVMGKIMERWMCTITFKDRDPTFHYVKKYIKDENLITHKGLLRATKKRPEENYW